VTTVIKSAEIPAGQDEVWATLTDFGRCGEWMTIHAGFPDGAPQDVSPDTSFRQKVKIMGMPGEVKWTFKEVDEPNRLAMDGEGPMGTKLRAVYLLESNGNGGTNFTYESEFGGAALTAMAGPLEKESNKAGEESLENFRGLFA
jgi:uncharacterized protein YndB with AHSA1/START domain